MKKAIITCCLVWLSAVGVVAQPDNYEWHTQSQNSSESMPCGGGDIGMNVWVEQGDVLFYVARSGSFDENNTLLKAGRFRLSLSPGLDMQHFRQTLHLNEGYVEVSDGQLSIQLWADVWKPVVHVDVSSPNIKQSIAVTYENWRTKEIALTKRESFQTSYKFAAPKGLTTHADSVVATSDELIFMHQNSVETIFDATVRQQGMDAVKDRLYNPLKNRIFGGRMLVKNMELVDQISGRYASSDYEGWMYATKTPQRTFHLQVVMATVQGTPEDWEAELDATEKSIRRAADCEASRQWWREFWQRSYIDGTVQSSKFFDQGQSDFVDDKDQSSKLEIIRNYNLFRYMLGCNAHSQWPTKFNGGLWSTSMLPRSTTSVPTSAIGAVVCIPHRTSDWSIGPC